MNTTILNLLATCIAPSTRAVYKRAYNNFLSFHTKYYPHSEIFPISHLHLAQFIAFNIQNGLKGSSIQTQVAGLSYLNKMMGFPSLADHFLVKKLLWSASKATYAHDKRCPITIPMLRRLLAALQINKASMFEQLAYRAMFLTSFFALLRVGEMAWTLQGSSNLLQFQDVKLMCINNIATQITLNMKHHKHSKGAPLPITLYRSSDTEICPVAALSDYLNVRGSKPGPLFISEASLPIQSSQFARTLNECVRTIGLSPEQYTSHSFRIGGASYAHQNNLSDTQIRRLGRWRSSAYLRYIRSPALVPKYTPQKRNYKS